MAWPWLQKIKIDWLMLVAVTPIVLVGLLTMNSFSGDSYFFGRQTIWFLVALSAFFGCSLVDWRFLRRSGTVAGLYVFMIGVLTVTLLLAQATKGAKSWLSVFGFTFEPADFMSLVMIFILAKYFSRRHVEIAHYRHIVVSGIYAFIPFVLILLQPNFGSAIIIFAIWLGMIMVSGVSKKHLFIVFAVGVLAFASLWLFVFQPYQKARLVSFIHPLADIRGAGYNAFQSMVAVGSGQIVGKGVGYGTQSRLKFLPEYETDFIFAAFAEEWGFVGVCIFFFLFGVVIWRILAVSLKGATNFEILFGLGVAILLMAHFIVHIGMNVGLLPVTGLPLPFMSYGGSHLLNEFIMLGIINGMRHYGLAYHRSDVQNEFIGPQ